MLLFRIVRKEDVGFCKVWNDNDSDREGMVIWIIIALIPMICGPIFTSIMELLFYLSKKCSKSASPATPSLGKYWILFILLRNYSFN